MGLTNSLITSIIDYIHLKRYVKRVPLKARNMPEVTRTDDQRLQPRIHMPQWVADMVQVQHLRNGRGTLEPVYHTIIAAFELAYPDTYEMMRPKENSDHD